MEQSKKSKKFSAAWNPKMDGNGETTISYVKIGNHHPIDSQPFINGWPWGSRCVELFFLCLFPAVTATSVWLDATSSTFLTDCILTASLRLRAQNKSLQKSVRKANKMNRLK